MSTTTARHSLAEAQKAAELFRALFPPECFWRWVVAGSVRRRCDDVGDIEHVVIPAFGTVPGPAFSMVPGKDLFATRERVNLLWTRLDELVVAKTVTNKIYGTTGFPWGERHRSVLCDGIAHELYTALPDAFGAEFAIRTGPAEFSTKLVSSLRRQGRRNLDGSVWACDLCECGGKDHLCRLCQGDKDGLRPISKIAVKDEEHYFDLCGVPYVAPNKRT